MSARRYEQEQFPCYIKSPVMYHQGSLPHLFTVDVQLLERVDGDQDVPHVRVHQPLLVALAQLRHNDTLWQKTERRMQPSLRWNKICTYLINVLQSSKVIHDFTGPQSFQIPPELTQAGVGEGGREGGRERGREE